MKYAISYNANFRYIKDIDEIILYWSTKDDIVDYVESTFEQNQRIIISFMEQDTDYIMEKLYPVMMKFKKVHNNVSVRFDGFIPENDVLVNFEENGIRYFFDQHCSCWDALYGLTLLGASDVYVTEEMCFDLSAISAFCKPRGVKVRIIPNVAQYGGHGIAHKIPDMVKFFVRPEDTSLYEPFVDVFELWGESNKLSVYYEIYKQEQWLGQIGDLIIGFTDDVPNSGIMTHFAGIRLNCRKKCLQGKKCDICKTMKEVAINLAEHDLRIETERKPIRENDTDIKKIMSDGRTTSDENVDKTIKE